MEEYDGTSRTSITLSYVSLSVLKFYAVYHTKEFSQQSTVFGYGNNCWHFGSFLSKSDYYFSTALSAIDAVSFMPSQPWVDCIRFEFFKLYLLCIFIIETCEFLLIRCLNLLSTISSQLTIVFIYRQNSQVYCDAMCDWMMEDLAFIIEGGIEIGKKSHKTKS